MVKSIVSQEDGQISFGQGHELVSTLLRAGMSSKNAQTVIENPILAQKIVSLMASKSFDFETRYQINARYIMGSAFLGIYDVILGLGEFFKVEYTPDMLKKLEEIPYSDEVLKQCRRSHILFPGYPLSVADLIRQTKPPLEWIFFVYLWEREETFIHTTVPVRWHLIRKDIFPGSKNKTFNEQLKLLPPVEEPPLFCELLFMRILWGIIRREVFFKNSYVRCRDIESSGQRVILGEKEINLRRLLCIAKDPDLGLASSWKIYC